MGSFNTQMESPLDMSFIDPQLLGAPPSPAPSVIAAPLTQDSSANIRDDIAVFSSFFGTVDTTHDALRLVNAAINRVIPVITRRLIAADSRALAGHVFIFKIGKKPVRWTGLS